MSSLKMTFSLTSLIFLIALGLVFVPASVMAHDTDADTAGDQPDGHVHHSTTPMVADADIKLVSALDGTVNGTNVVLVDDVAATTPVKVNPGTAGAFQVEIKFSEPVYAYTEDLTASPPTFTFPDVTTALAATDLAATDFMITAASRSVNPGANLFGSGNISVTVARKAGETAGTFLDDTFLLTFAVPAAANPAANATATPPVLERLPIDVWITLNKDAVASQTKLVDGIETTGVANAASMRKKFTIVKMVDPPVTNTVTIALPDDAGPGAKFTAKLTFDDPVTALAANQVLVTGGFPGTPVKDTTTTDGTVWNVEITPGIGAKQITVAVVDTLATGTAAKTTVDDGTPIGDEEAFGPGEYFVVVRDTANPPDFGTATPTLIEWAAMPNLHELFLQNTKGGGTLNVKVAGATRLQVVISEVMWAVDERLVGQDGYDANQWFEIHNKTTDKSFAVSGITFATQEGRPALGEETDRVSNLVGGGADWIGGKGQSGNSGATDANGVTTGEKEFISMYRNNYGEPGHQAARWTKSTQLYKRNHRGTPGAKEAAGTSVIAATKVPRSPVIFNEISNHDNPAYEWIELRFTGDANLKDYEVTIVTTKGAPPQDGHHDADFIDFSTDDLNMKSGDILLVVSTDPSLDVSHPLATGWNVDKAEADQINGVNANSPRYVVAPFGKAKMADGTDQTESGLPDDGEFVLILRNRHDRNGSTNDDNIRDIAGFVTGDALKVDNASLFTNLWPLKNFGAANRENNKLAAGTVQRRQYDDIDGTGTKDANQNDKTAFRDDDNGWTSIGYRRHTAATAQNGGTPGYPNGAKQGSDTQAAADAVVISEIMFATGNRANTPQWIELHNTSKTVGVDLDGWQVTIVNHDKDNADGDLFAGDLSKTYAITGKVLPPNQTLLLVAYRGRSSSLNNGKPLLPTDRIIPLRADRGDLILSQYGFEIKVETKAADNVRKMVDMAGNLAAVPAGTGGVRANPQSYVDPAWMLPMPTDADGNRVSIVRVSMNRTALGGQLVSAWKQFDMSAHSTRTIDKTYYGHATDVSSPGHTVGGVLPVSLSKFRPERMKDTGEIVVRWVTQSELNNAGFNILRSEKRDGEFTKVHFEAGQGTTSERTAYEWRDKSAKPNVVYYYQIQDVSLDGDVTTLRITHLRGNVTAVGKLTTTWGEIKALQ